MQTNIRSNGGELPLDAEIDHDVAELRALLRGIPAPSEPHPAYWQNFVIRVRHRVDEQGEHRRKWRMVARVASAGVVATMLTLVATTDIFRPTNQLLQGPEIKPPVASTQMAASVETELLFASNESLILSQEDKQMLNAIMSDDDAAIFEALVGGGQL